MDTIEAESLVREGIEAAQAGNKERAEDLLSRAVALDPRNEQAWLWLSAVVVGINAQRECLQRVLEIDPANPFARTGLAFVNHLRMGYEYLAVRAPWMTGAEAGRAALADLPSRRCPQCDAVNPGWAYLCNRCTSVLDQVDVAEVVKREIRRTGPSHSLVRPWAAAAVLDAARAFAPEVALASPVRAVLTVVLGAVALNLLRAIGTLGLVTFTAARLSTRLLDRLAVAFLSDQISILAGGLAAWVLLAAATLAVARSQGGLGNPWVHYYLVAVAVSAWLPIAGVTALIWWAAALLIPGAPVPLVAALACGLLSLYLVTLLTQAVHTTHGQQQLRETVAIGALLVGSIVVYAGLTALSPPALEGALLRLARVVILPLGP